MVGIKLILAIIISFLFLDGTAYALYKDKGFKHSTTEEQIEVDNVLRVRERQAMQVEKKKISQKVIPIRKKRAETLTPFVYAIPEYEIKRRESAKKFLLEEKAIQEIPQKDVKNSTNENILAQVIISSLITIFLVAGAIFAIKKYSLRVY